MANETKDFLRELPGLTDGLIVVMPPTLEPHQQRLLAGLGVLVRFDLKADQSKFQEKNAVPVSQRWRASPGKPRLWQRVEAHLADGKNHRMTEIADSLQADRSAVSKVLRQLAEDDKVVRIKRGLYRIAKR